METKENMAGKKRKIKESSEEDESYSDERKEAEPVEKGGDI